MKLLHANDAPGKYPQSWYAATAHDLPEFAPLKSDERANVCVIGAGYTGLSAALHLAKKGHRVILLEAQRVGFGASGRNGGQLGSGQRQDQEALIKMVGAEDARKLWLLGEEAKQVTKGLIEKHNIHCDLKPGVAWAASSPREAQHMLDYAVLLEREYGYDQIECFDHEGFDALCPSPVYRGGILDMGAGHLHPLNYALGLARACRDAGVQIYERSEVIDVADGSPAIVRTIGGLVRAENVILATNGYLGGLNRKVAARVMPINNFIAATEPLGTETARVLARDIAVADDKFVVNYFRLSADGRLLFGGGESYGYRFPADIAAKVRKPMADIFPHLSDVRIDYAWGGTLAITMKRLPHFARLSQNILSASGYSGHGVGTATHAGMLMAQAVAGRSDGFDTMSRLPTPAFPGGAGLRSPLLVLAMTWFALRDRLGI